MFTGIIVELGKAVEIKKLHRGAKLKVLSKTLLDNCIPGDSIAVNGVCLTVTEIDKSKGILSFDISHETLQKTTLGELKKGDPVNLEPALTLSSRLGGHLVSGHVEGTGVIRKIHNEGEYLEIEIEAPDDILKYCIKKGSIAVDGISLTIVDISKKAFTVVIIPHTAKMTTIGSKKIGDRVNLESDIIAKYVERLLNQGILKDEGSLVDKLRNYGYLME